MSLRPGAVDFDSKWNGLKVTIHDVVQLRRVRMAIWNDHYSYPINSNKILHMGPFLYLNKCLLLILLCYTKQHVTVSCCLAVFRIGCWI